MPENLTLKQRMLATCSCSLSSNGHFCGLL